jgi:hypothetical protein
MVFRNVKTEVLQVCFLICYLVAASASSINKHGSLQKLYLKAIDQLEAYRVQKGRASQKNCPGKKKFHFWWENTLQFKKPFH